MGDSIEVKVQGPFSVGPLLAYLGTRAIPGVELVGSARYRRVLGGERLSVLDVDFSDLETDSVIRASSSSAIVSEAEVRAIVGRLLDIDAPSVAIADRLRTDAALAPLLARHPGARIPGTVDPFELSIRAILGQQISVAAARTLAHRIAIRWGSKVETGSPDLTLSFPSAEQLIGAKLEQAGVSPRRATAIRELAMAVIEGGIDLAAGRERAEEIEQILLGVPGIGPWTAAYICLRGLGDRDAIPVGDLGLRQALAGSGGPWRAQEVVARAESWRPWRGYAAVHLWSTYLDAGIS